MSDGGLDSSRASGDSDVANVSAASNSSSIILDTSVDLQAMSNDTILLGNRLSDIRFEQCLKVLQIILLIFILRNFYRHYFDPKISLLILTDRKMNNLVIRFIYKFIYLLLGHSPFQYR